MDHTSGFHAALAIVAALHQHRRTGLPQYVDLAAREVASAMIGDALLLASLGIEPQRPGNADAVMVPHGVYATRTPDRWLSIAVRGEAQWGALLDALGQSPAADDPRFSSASARRAHREELDALLELWLSEHDADETAAALQERGVAAHVS